MRIVNSWHRKQNTRRWCQHTDVFTLRRVCGVVVPHDALVTEIFLLHTELSSRLPLVAARVGGIVRSEDQLSMRKHVPGRLPAYLTDIGSSAVGGTRETTRASAIERRGYVRERGNSALQTSVSWEVSTQKQSKTQQSFGKRPDGSKKANLASDLALTKKSRWTSKTPSTCSFEKQTEGWSSARWQDGPCSEDVAAAWHPRSSLAALVPRIQTASLRMCWRGHSRSSKKLFGPVFLHRQQDQPFQRAPAECHRREQPGGQLERTAVVLRPPSPSSSALDQNASSGLDHQARWQKRLHLHHPGGRFSLKNVSSTVSQRPSSGMDRRAVAPKRPRNTACPYNKLSLASRKGAVCGWPSIFGWCSSSVCCTHLHGRNCGAVQRQATPPSESASA